MHIPQALITDTTANNANHSNGWYVALFIEVAIAAGLGAWSFTAFKRGAGEDYFVGCANLLAATATAGLALKQIGQPYLNRLRSWFHGHHEDAPHAVSLDV